MNRYEKYFFEEGKDEFVDDKKRLHCVEKFLAYHSYDIGHHEPKDEDLGLEFKNDKEVYEAMLQPEKYKSVISWIKQETKRDIKDTWTYVNLKVGDYKSSYLINTYELFSDCLLPWLLKQDEKRIWVFLSMMQKELIFDKGITCSYYKTENGYEPYIVDEKHRVFLLNNIIKNGDFKMDNKITVLNFNGDRDLFRAWSGTNTTFYEFKDITDFEQSLQEKLKTIEGTPFVIRTFCPATKEILNTGILSS